MNTRRVILITLVLTAVVLQIITIVIQVRAINNYDIVKEWYSQGGSGNSYFNIQYGPPRWLLDLMLPLLYIYQLIWLIYALWTLKLRGSAEYEAYHMPLSLYVCFISGLVFRLSWSVLLPTCGATCPVLQLGSFLSMAAALCFALRALVVEAETLYQIGWYYDVTLVRALVHNGLGWYATWELIDLSVSVSGIMARDEYTQKDSTMTMLGILGILLLFYILADVPLLDLYTRYLLTPYVVLSLYFIAIVDQHPDSGMVYIMAAILLTMSVLGTAFKIIGIFARRRHSPEPIPLDFEPVRPRRKRSLATRMSTRMSMAGVDAMSMSYI